MEAQYRSQDSRLLIVLLSISLHTTALILLFIIHVSQAPFEITDKPHNSPLYDPTVIFQDAPDTEPVQQPQGMQTATAPEATTVNSSLILNDQKIDDDLSDEGFTQPDSAAALPSPQETLPVSQKLSHLDPPLLPTHVRNDKPKRKRRRSDGPAHRPSQERRKAAAALGRLTQGFIKSLEQEQSTKSKVQDDVDLISYRMYIEKLCDVIYQTVNANQKPLYLPRSVETNVVAIITIDKKGTLLDFVLEHPNKTPEILEIERLLYDAARKGGLYPPIPSKFKTDKMSFKQSLHVSGQQGLHTYTISKGVRYR